MIVLDSNSERDLEIKTSIFDINHRELNLSIATSCQNAGRKAIFYVKSMVINNTKEDIKFYYEQPNQKEVN